MNEKSKAFEAYRELRVGATQGRKSLKYAGEQQVEKE